jgi:hypothetical protein
MLEQNRKIVPQLLLDKLIGVGIDKKTTCLWRPSSADQRYFWLHLQYELGLESSGTPHVWPRCEVASMASAWHWTPALTSLGYRLLPNLREHTGA